MLSGKKKHPIKDWMKRHFAQPYTIMMVPHNLEKPIQFRLRIGVVPISLAVIVGMLIATIVFAYYSSQYQQVSEENVVLISNNMEQKEKIITLSEAQAQLEQVLLENEKLREENVVQEAKIAELSLIANDTMRQIDEMILMQNQLRAELGLEAIEAMGGPKEVGRTAAEMSFRRVSRGRISLDEIAEIFSGAQLQLSYQEEGFLEISNQTDYLNSIPSRWPVNSRNITSEYGTRNNPFGGYSSEGHWGIDIGCPTGTPIYASGKGEVVTAEWESGYGYTVVVDHGYGYLSRYSHCSRLLVKEGEQVEAGQTIALVGSTGRSTGPHLDFRIQYNGEFIDPYTILRKES